MDRISKEYAEALFILAKESGKETDILDSLNFVLNMFEENPRYAELLANPGISKKERTESLFSVFENSVEEEVISFISILCENGLIRGFSDSVEDYEAFYLISKNIAVAKVTSAVPLFPEEEKRLKEKLEEISKGSVKLNCKVDSSLLGGIVVEINGKIIDGSVKRRLDEIKDVIDI